MTNCKLIARSCRYYWRTHLGVVLGAAVATAVLTGAMLVGDSVRYTLRRTARLRLGGVTHALGPQGRFFRVELADGVSHRLGSAVAPVLAVRGSAVRRDRAARANNVQILGVDDRFWRLGGAEPPIATDADGRCVLNDTLAGRLGLSAGQEVLLRIEKPALLPRDAPLSRDKDSILRAPMTVAAVAGDENFGRFSLQADQAPPLNVFVPLRWLGEKLGQPGRANMLLLAGADKLSTEAADAALRQSFRLADAGLELRELIGGVIELRSSRVFFDKPVAEAAIKASPNARGILTYFVNEFRAGRKTTPYSIVAAMENLPASVMSALKRIPAPLKDDEILINDWLADDLRVKAGDAIEMKYFVPGPMRRLIERSAEFRVARVLAMSESTAGADLMPDFPGVSDAENCRDWKPGIPIALDRIRPKDERYWRDYRGTPKAFVTLAAGQRMWSSRFGSLTAVRYTSAGGGQDALAEAIRRELDPASVGMFFQPVRKRAMTAGDKATDFGQLFLGFSFFLIAAAALLTALLFALGVQQRSEQVGTLLALGFRPQQVRRLLLAEGGLLAVAGSLVGAAMSVLYTRAILLSLHSFWPKAVANSAVVFHATGWTLLRGCVAGVAVALAAIWLVLLRQARRSPRQLLAGGAERESLAAGAAARKGRIALWIAVVAALAAVAIVAFSGVGRDTRAATAFFAAGGLLLVAGIAACHTLLGRIARTVARGGKMTLGGLGLRNISRRRWRSLAVIALLACGTFLIVSVGANRKDPFGDARKYSSGTGGFALWGETAAGVFRDLNDPAALDHYGLKAGDLKGARFLQMSIREGDDASCMNLNRAQHPRLIGVDAAMLAERKAFTFTKTLDGEADNGWLLLGRPQPDGAVPAVGDEDTIVYALGKKVGDALDYTDEHGRTFRIRIVGQLATSVFQGGLLISEENFKKHFPSRAGYRLFLIDAPQHRKTEITGALSRNLSEFGMEVTPTEERLAAFNAVYNTYLSIFQVLGGLGMLLGSAGMGLIVLRNVLERRSELALLRAVGFRRRSLLGVVAGEHACLVGLGMACGVVAAIVAVLPAIRSPGAQVPYASLAGTLLAVLVAAVGWTLMATWLALRGPLLPALRSE